MLDGLRKDGSSTGAMVEVVASGMPAGLGAPVYGKLDADIAAAMMSINAVKGVEIGDGFAAAACAARRTPTRCAWQGKRSLLQDNHAGGILGGISTGQDIVAALRRQADQFDPVAARDRDGRRRGHGDLDQGPA